MGKACVQDPFWPTSQLELGLQYLKYQRGKWPVNPSPHEETYGSFDCRRCAGSQSLWGVRCCQHPAKAAARSPTKVTQHSGADAAGPLSAVSTFAISRWDGKIKMRHPRQQLSYHRGGEGFSLPSPLAEGLPLPPGAGVGLLWQGEAPRPSLCRGRCVAFCHSSLFDL